MTRYIIPLALALGLAACANQTPTRTIYEVAGDLTIAETAATQYAKLPVCPAGKTKTTDGRLCQDPVITGQMKAAGQTARDKVKAAEANPSTAAVQAADAALSILKAVTPAATTNN